MNDTPETRARTALVMQMDRITAERLSAVKRAETAEQSARDLAKALQFYLRTLYAASIDISRGDRDAAIRLILNGQPGQWDGERWNGFETGEAWLNRTENPVPGPPAGDGRDETPAGPVQM